MRAEDLSPHQFLNQSDSIIKIELTVVRGSSPRAAGTFMLATGAAVWGTIGGGQLEFMAIEHARDMLVNGAQNSQLNVPLGPEIGQCCGGHVEIVFSLIDAQAKKILNAQAAEEIDELPHVYIFGAGHVGRSLALSLQHLPMRCILIDTRAQELDLCGADVEMRQSVLPENDVRHAPSGSAFVVLTHDHALDFLITSAALARADAAYVGMIGSGTKRASFASWCLRASIEQSLDALICPIGFSSHSDKRPSIIAAHVTAEIINAQASYKLAQI
jgi:xanthine dehydrogenase accessory factor